jgi:hypothetical protein
VRSLPKRLFLFFVQVFSFRPLVAYSITIEEFIAKYPNAVVALIATCYPNGYDKSITWSSGLMDDDPYGLNKRHRPNPSNIPER